LAIGGTQTTESPEDGMKNNWLAKFSLRTIPWAPRLWTSVLMVHASKPTSIFKEWSFGAKFE